MLAGTLVTIAGFVPVGFAASSAGEYTFSLFAVVAIALIVSWFVAVIFAPLLGVLILKPPKSTEAKEGFLLRLYRGLLTGAIRARWLTIPLALGLFVASIFAFPLIPNQFFPSSDRPELLVDLTLPQNASIHATKTMAERFDAVLKGDPDVDALEHLCRPRRHPLLSAARRAAAQRFLRSGRRRGEGCRGARAAQGQARKALAEDFPAVVARVYPLELGPPVGWPVQYRVSGPDLGEVREIALKLAQVVATSHSAKNVNFDWIEPAREVRIQIDQDQARLLGLSSDALASVLNTVISGISISQVRDDIYLVDVVVRSTDEERASLATLQPVAGSACRTGARFRSVSSPRSNMRRSAPVVWRRDRIPTLTVQADVMPGVLPETVVNSLAPDVDSLAKSLPPSYAIAVGGTVEESKKSQASVIAVVPLMLLIMITVLMFQLKSFRRLFLALSVAPLGLIGVVGALLLSGRPLGFVAILGILALLGMITKNAVILIGQIDSEREQGKDVMQAAIDASSARLRPIVLTAISTVLGMIPIAPTVFWGPMAVSIMGGLLVATLLTLIVLPTAYVAMFGTKAKAGPIEAQA